MIEIIRTDSAHPHFRELVTELDIGLAINNGEEHGFYAQFNSIDKIKHAVVAYIDDIPAGCGAFKEYGKGVVEIKRMFTRPGFRGKGVATQILNALEHWASGTGYHSCILETGVKQLEAIRLYDKSGYHRIPNYGQYTGKDNSLCFQKTLLPAI